MKLSLDKALGLSWLNWFIPLLTIIIVVIIIGNWDNNRLEEKKTEGFENAVDQVKQSTHKLKEKDNADAKKIHNDIQHRTLSDIDKLLNQSIPPPDNNRADNASEMEQSTMESRGSAVIGMHSSPYQAVPSRERSAKRSLSEKSEQTCEFEIDEDSPWLFIETCY